jgi:hypothetical protein
MQHIANDDDAAPPQAVWAGIVGPEVTRQGEEIQQALAGMAVQAIAGVEHRDPLAAAIKGVGQIVGYAGAAMAHHQHIGSHRHIGAGGIEQALPLAQGAGGGRETLHIGRQSAGRQLEAAAGAGTGLKEQAGHQPALQRRQLAGARHRQGTEALGELQNDGKVGDRKGRQIEHMAVGPAAQGSPLTKVPQP